MQILYKNKRLEKVLVGINALAAAVVAASFVALFGFDKEFFRTYWFEIPLLLALAIAVFGAGRWSDIIELATVRHLAVGIYLVLQVVTKLCRTSVNLAASGRNPTKTLIASFLVLIISGAGLLMLPKASAAENISLVDALFTATSATCVTGLIVKDTGSDFSLMGQVIILALIPARRSWNSGLRCRLRTIVRAGPEPAGAGRNAGFAKRKDPWPNKQYNSFYLCWYYTHRSGWRRYYVRNVRRCTRLDW
jgi:hypothetical protein